MGHYDYEVLEATFNAGGVTCIGCAITQVEMIWYTQSCITHRHTHTDASQHAHTHTHNTHTHTHTQTHTDVPQYTHTHGIVGTGLIMHHSIKIIETQSPNYVAM